MKDEDVPPSPNTDRNDPIVMRRAAGIAKRRNSATRKKWPLLAPLIPEITAEDVIEQRERAHVATVLFFREKDEREALQIEEWKSEIRELVGETEFSELERKVNERNYGSRWMSWLAMRDSIRERATEEMPEAADLIFAWLSNWEGEPPTHWELHQSCGDGLTVEEVSAGLHWLYRRELLEICVGRPCRVSDVPHCATWRVPAALRNKESKP